MPDDPNTPPDPAPRGPAAPPGLAVANVLEAVYADLRAMAERHLAGERAGHTLQPTALVHEVYLKLADQHSVGWTSRAHFLGVAAQAMRRILVDYARTRKAAKRGGGRRTSLDEALDAFESRSHDLVALDDALHELAEVDPHKSRIVEARFFGGMTASETAELLGVSLRTVERDWTFARAFLRERLEAKA